MMQCQKNIKLCVNEPSVARFEILTVVLKISIGLLGCDGGGTTPL